MPTSLRFQVLTGLDDCRKAWNMFSEDRDMFDVWDYRACFFDPKLHGLHFILGSIGDEPACLMPLWKSMQHDYYEWFGGQIPEGNKFFTRKDEHIPLMLGQLPKNTWLTFIDEKYRQYFTPTGQDQGFFIDLAAINYSVEKYLEGFGKKHRKNFQRDLSALSAKGALVIRNMASDLSHIAEWSRSKFQKESFFSEEGFSNGMGRLVALAQEKGELEMLSIVLGGRAVASEVAVLHNQVYTVLFGGSEPGAANVGKMLSFEHIRNACEKKARVIDFLSSDCGWKKLWNMSEKALLEYDSEGLLPSHH